MDIIVKKEEKTLEKNGGMASVPFFTSKKIFFVLTSKVVQFSETNEVKIAVIRHTVSVTVLFTYIQITF